MEYYRAKHKDTGEMSVFLKIKRKQGDFLRNGKAVWKWEKAVILNPISETEYNDVWADFDINIFKGQ